MHYKAIPDPEPTLPEGLLSDLLNHSQGISISLGDVIENLMELCLHGKWSQSFTFVLENVWR